jgi:hypothetical protein
MIVVFNNYKGGFSMKALLVGINTTPNAPLNGCVNDVTIMRQILLDKYKASSDDVHLLLDDRATKKNIMDRLNWLINDDDHLKLFHYSGHGAQVPQRGNDIEEDNMDECLVPVDYNWDTNMILDNELNDMFKKLKPQHKLVCIFDACHSGTMYRDEKIKSKFISPPTDILFRHDNNTIYNVDALFNNDEYQPVMFNITIKNKDISTKFKDINNMNLIVYSACKDDQTSADAFFGNRYQGVLSYYLEKALIKYDGMICYKKLFDEVFTDVQNDHQFTQTPQFYVSNEDLNAYKFLG